MNIKFLIGYPAKSIATEWREINTLPKTEIAPDEDTFLLFKALELNSTLEKELIKARKNLRLPENGLPWEQYKIRHDTKANHTESEIEDISFYYSNCRKESDRIERKLYLHPKIREQLGNLILGDYVEPFYNGILFDCSGANVGDYESTDDFDEYTEVEVVRIDITKRISKNELLKFVNENWAGIANLFNYLPEEKRVYISPRDMRIVDLRDNQKLKYSQIADQIVKELSIDDPKGTINEDSIKTSYKRAKSKIEELAISRR